MRTNNKKGISLIVLVITIIVMIILATAIILSLNNSGIIEKANKAKTDSDMSNLKEYANVLEAEWELMTESEKTNAGVGSSTEYVNKKFKDNGYTDLTYSADGEIYVGLQGNTKDAISKGLKIGDEVTGYTLDETPTSTPTSGNENTATADGLAHGDPVAQNVSKTNFQKWVYMGINKDGELMITPEMVASACTMRLSGYGGFKNGPGTLNTVCGILYGTDKGTARSMNMDDVCELLGYIGPKGGWYVGKDGVDLWTDDPKSLKDLAETGGFTGNSGLEYDGDVVVNNYGISSNDDYITNEAGKNIVFQGLYWLASSCSKFIDVEFWYLNYGVRYVGAFEAGWNKLCMSDGTLAEAYEYSVRPVVELYPEVEFTKVENGKWSI